MTHTTIRAKAFGVAAALAAATAAVPASAAVPVYPTAGTENPATYSFVAGMSGEVGAYFIGSSAGFTSIAGLLVNGVDTGITGLQNHTSSPGDFLSFGNVNAGDVLTFYIKVLTSGEQWFTDSSLNTDGNRQHVYAVTPYTGGDFGIPVGDYTYLGFEDIRDPSSLNIGIDYDYNDIEYAFSYPAVPEPATWAMMLVGFGLVGFSMRSRKDSQTRVRFAM
jgi:hypothetical protein